MNYPTYSSESIRLRSALTPSPMPITLSHPEGPFASRKKNGGYPKVITWQQFDAIYGKGINLFHILRQITEEHMSRATTLRKTFLLALIRENQSSSGRFITRQRQERSGLGLVAGAHHHMPQTL